MVNELFMISLMIALILILAMQLLCSFALQHFNTNVYSACHYCSLEVIQQNATASYELNIMTKSLIFYLRIILHIQFIYILNKLDLFS